MPEGLKLSRGCLVGETKNSPSKKEGQKKNLMQRSKEKHITKQTSLIEKQNDATQSSCKHSVLHKYKTYTRGGTHGIPRISSCDSQLPRASPSCSRDCKFPIPPWRQKNGGGKHWTREHILRGLFFFSLGDDSCAESKRPPIPYHSPSHLQVYLVGSLLIDDLQPSGPRWSCVGLPTHRIYIPPGR